jgi:hypothetical protein
MRSPQAYNFVKPHINQPYSSGPVKPKMVLLTDARSGPLLRKLFKIRGMKKVRHQKYEISQGRYETL